MREMVGGCCVCSDERGWAENPLVYCDGHGCTVAVHQACYGIVQVPTGPWFCRKCESQERAARVRCELCPHKDGALKRTDSGGWAHVVCALYIPEVQFANVLTMEPIILQYVPHERYIKTCYICEDHGRESKAACGACMTCNRQGCRQAFHVTCAQMAGLLCEEEGPEADNVKYCGYCKHHYNKMQKKLRSSENAGSSFSHSRGRSSSPSQDKQHHHHKPRRSHKDKNRQKERYKKSTESLSSSVTSASGVEKITSSHHSNKDSDGKSKKLSSHSHSHHSKKTGSTGKSCSSSSCSSSPFNTGGALSAAQDFDQFSSSSRMEHDRGGDDHSREKRSERHRRSAVHKEEEDVEEEEKEDDKDEEEEEEDSKYHKPPALTPADCPLTGSQSHERAEGTSSPFENKVTISTFGSIMRITSSSSLGSSSKVRKISSSADYKPSKTLGKLSQMSAPPILEEAPLKEKAAPPPPLPLPREWRHHGNKKSRHGPGRPRGSKNRKSREEDHHRHHHPPTAPPPPALSSSLYPSPSFPSTLPPTSSSSSFSSSSVGSFSAGRGNALLGSDVYPSLKDPLTLGGGVCSSPLSLGGGVCSTSSSLGGGMSSTSLSSGLLPSSLSLPSVGAASNTQVHPGSSASYSLNSSQPFASGLSSSSNLPPLLSQAQTSLPEADLDDCRFPCQGNSPRESLSSQSPMSCLPLLFDQRDGLGSGVRSRPENVPPASSHIELLLEKHGNGEMGVNIVEMLQSLHSLQQENQRLQDQILGLTAKKERLQLLNTELASPFQPHVQSASHHTSAPISFLSSSQGASLWKSVPQQLVALLPGYSSSPAEPRLLRPAPAERAESGSDRRFGERRLCCGGWAHGVPRRKSSAEHERRDPVSRPQRSAAGAPHAASPAAAAQPSDAESELSASQERQPVLSSVGAAAAPAVPHLTELHAGAAGVGLSDAAASETEGATAPHADRSARLHPKLTHDRSVSQPVVLGHGLPPAGRPRRRPLRSARQRAPQTRGSRRERRRQEWLMFPGDFL
nr:protein AF-17 isoform X2 [Nothobranchius furzeri]